MFAQTLFGFALAAADPRIVGINFVGAEDSQIAMADYADHMRMVAFVRRLYPNVHVSLHAGELAPGLVPPESLPSAFCSQSPQSSPPRVARTPRLRS